MGRSAGLAVPGRERVPKIVPAEIRDACPFQRLPPGQRADLHDGLTSEGEHPRCVLAVQLAQDGQGHLVQGHRMRLAILVLAARDPEVHAVEVDVLPLQILDVRLPQPRGDREQRHVGEVLGQFLAEALELQWAERTNAAFGFPEQVELWHPVDPFPFAIGTAKDGTDQREVAVRGSCRRDLLALELDAIDQRSVDLVEVLASQVGIEPAKLCLVGFVRGLVLRFQEPAHDRLLPGVPRLHAEPVLLPSCGGELVVDLLRLPLVGSPSALL